MCLGQYFFLRTWKHEEKAIKDWKKGGGSPVAPLPLAEGLPRIKLLANSALSQRVLDSQSCSSWLSWPLHQGLRCMFSSLLSSLLSSPLSIQSCLPPLLAPCLLQPKPGTAARGMWPQGQLLWSRWVIKACNRSSFSCLFFFCVCLFVSFRQHWNIALPCFSFNFPHFSDRRWLWLLSCPGCPWHWLRLWAIFPSSPSQAAFVSPLVLFWVGKKITRKWKK